MTQMPTERRRSSGQRSWLWMLSSIVVIAGFMYWLAVTAEPTVPPVVEVEESPLDASGATSVQLSRLILDLATYVGQEVRLDDIPVASMVSAQAFWTTAEAGGSPFLIRVGPALVAEGFAVAGGDTLSVVGRVAAMSDSVLAAWEQEGVLENENQRLQAEFAPGFVEARLAEVRARAAAPADTSGMGSAGASE